MADANLNEQLQKIDDSIKRYEAQIARGEALERLKTNPDFISVIVEGYLEAEAQRLFDMLTEVPSIRRESMENTKDKLEAVRHFKSYIGTPTYAGIVMNEAANAPDFRDGDLLTRKDLLTEIPTEEEE